MKLHYKFIIAAIIPFLVGCAHHEESAKNQIKSIRVEKRTFTIDSNDQLVVGEITGWSPLNPHFVNFDNMYTHYTPQGKVDSVVYYNNNSEPDSFEISAYDKKGRLIAYSVDYNEPSSRPPYDRNIQKFVYEYDRNGNRTEYTFSAGLKVKGNVHLNQEYVYRPTTSQTKDIIGEYDEKGYHVKRVREKTTIGNRVFDDIALEYYDNKGNLVIWEQDHYKHVYSYDEHGQKVKDEYSEYGITKDIFVWSYQYDEKDNWITELYFQTPTSGTFTTRIIEYYE